MFGRARLKLTASYGAAMALILFGLGATAYAAAQNSLDDQIDGSLQQARSGLLAGGRPPAGELLPVDNRTGRNPAAGGARGAPEYGDDQRDDRTRSLPSDVFFVSATTDGAVLTNPRQVNLDGVNLASLASGATAVGRWEDVGSGRQRYRFVALTDPAVPANVFLIGRSLEGRDHQLDTLRTVFLAGGLAGLVLSSVGGFWLAGRSLVPIRRSLDSQRRFVSDASHELRTPLAVIRANNELLLRHLDGTIEENLDSIEAIAAESESMTRLVEDLLTLARADEGRLQISREPLDVGELVAEVTRDLGVLAESRGVNLRAETTGLTVDGDRQRLRQLMVILVDNGLKYTPTGGEVRVSARRAGRRAELRVTDSGPGIPNEDQGRIFDRFYRVDAARGRSDGGSGLGLAIAKSIVDVHNGSIGVESAPGRGTAFVVRLPIKE